MHGGGAVEGRPGRPRNDPNRYYDELLRVAELLCDREVLSVAAGARWVADHTRHMRIGALRLADLYRPRSRELQVKHMRYYHLKRTWMEIPPDDWQALLERVERLAAADERVEKIGRTVPKRKVTRRYSLPWSLWRPAEFEELLFRLEKEGIV